MATTITGGQSVISPTLLIELTESREGGAITHPVLGRVDPDVTLRPAGLRSGRIELGFAGVDADAKSLQAIAALAGASVFTLTDDDRPMSTMRFVVPQGSQIERTIEDETRAAFVVTVNYHEVGA